MSDDAAWLGKFMGSELDKVRADHAAFVARVREIAENMPHDPECESLVEEWVDRPGHIGFMFPYKCDCRRGKLLELCNG